MRHGRGDSNRALERCGHEERIDHRTLEAQRVEAQERATAAHDRGDEAEALRQTVRAVELDRDPLPQLSAGAWQMKERGIEVAAVRVWREVKAQAAEVARVAEVLAGQVRDWIGRAVDRLAAGAGSGLCRRCGSGWPGREAGPGRAVARGLGSPPEPHPVRCRGCTWSNPGARICPQPGRAATEAAQGIDWGTLAEATARLQESREAEERQRVQEAERLKEQERQQERLREREREARDYDRDGGLTH